MWVDDLSNTRLGSLRQNGELDWFRSVFTIACFPFTSVNRFRAERAFLIDTR